MSNSLNDHLANIVKSNTPNLKINTTVPLVPSNTSSTVEDANDADLKTDSSGWYQYNRYRYQPLYRPPFGLNPYYWPYVQYNHPFYPYQYRYRYRYPTYNYFGQYYTGMIIKKKFQTNLKKSPEKDRSSSLLGYRFL